MTTPNKAIGSQISKPSAARFLEVGLVKSSFVFRENSCGSPMSVFVGVQSVDGCQDLNNGCIKGPELPSSPEWSCKEILPGFCFR